MYTAPKRVKHKKLLTELALSKKEGFITSISIKVKGSHNITYDPDALLYKEDWYNYINQQNPIDSIEDIIKQDIKSFPNIDYINLKLAPNIPNTTLTKLSDYISKKYDCRGSILTNSFTIFAFS